MKYIAAYIRVSTDEQAERGNSLQEQQERLSAYCRAMGWPEPVFYVDDGYSAKDLKRPAIQRLLEDVRTGKIEVVLTSKLDRLCRNLLDLLQVIELFNEHGCSYISASESFDTSTAVGRMTLQLLGTFAEFERERISERVRDNMISLAKNTSKAISLPCYGLDVVDGQYAINQDEEPFVLIMCDLVEQGRGYRYIAKELNALGSTTKDGKPWDQVNVKRVLRNPKIAGAVLYNQRTTKNGKIIFRDPSEWIFKKNNHPAIIPFERWEKIQKILDSRSIAGKHAESETYLLTGLVKCHHCGRNMKGSTARHVRGGKNYTYYRYICASYVLGYGCKHHAVHRDDLEKIVIDEIRAIASGSMTELKINVALTTSVADEIKHIRDQLVRIDRRMQKQIEAYENDLISADDLKAARQRIETERQELKERLENLEHKKANPEEVQKRAALLLGEITGDDRVKAKHAIRQLIEEIQIEDGKLVDITWRG